VILRSRATQAAATTRPTGGSALLLNTTGSYNTATGFQALNYNNADNNTANGEDALFSNTIGSDNTANGEDALFSNTTGYYNTANGFAALSNNTTGVGNTANGFGALHNNTTGSSNTAVGVGAGSNVTTADNVICIGTDGENVSNSCFINNIFGVTTLLGDALNVVVDGNGQLGTMSSSRRFKTDIKPMDKASEAVLALKPVTFHYKSSSKATPQFGLIAEEVAEVNPDLVVRDKNGEIYTVRYDAVNAMLLNEFLKEHKTVQELKSTADKQEATIAELQSTVAQQQQRMKVLTAQLKEQAAQIQKASTEIQIARPARHMVLNNP
jgi:uncharacterized coiled-coil protein SlyX